MLLANTTLYSELSSDIPGSLAAAVPSGKREFTKSSCKTAFCLSPPISVLLNHIRYHHIRSGPIIQTQTLFRVAQDRIREYDVTNSTVHVDTRRHVERYVIEGDQVIVRRIQSALHRRKDRPVTGRVVDSPRIAGEVSITIADYNSCSPGSTGMFHC